MHENNLKETITAYWNDFQNPILSTLLTTYDVLELENNAIDLSEDFYRDLADFCQSCYELRELTDSVIDNIAVTCAKLPTTLLTYFLHQLHVKNSEVFQVLYSKISTPNDDYSELFSRCMSFEKNQILARVFDEARLYEIQEALPTIYA